MKNRGLIVISVLITVLILTVIGGLTMVVSKGNPSTTQASTHLDATREAQYVQLIAQANQTINQANQEILSLQTQLDQKTLTTATPYPILSEQASSIAVNVTGEKVIGTPTLVNYSGSAAYEITFPDGKVYIDANTGKVLYNGVLASQTISPEQAAQIAINYTGNSQVSAVESGIYQDYAAYRVTFTNGEIVYMNVYGKILAIQLPPSAGGGVESEQENDD